MPLISTLAGASAKGFGGMITFGPSALMADILVVAGGGGGGGQVGGGGGAGGVLEHSSITLDLNTTYPTTIGGGGPGGNYVNNGLVSNRGFSGTNSQFGSLTACVGGGGGGGYSGHAGLNGGSGGGSDGGTPTGIGLGTTNQGNNGGQGFATDWGGGGGGGAGAVGANATANNGGNGGIGRTSSVINAMGAATSSGQNSSGTYYFGGGGGGCNSSNSVGIYGSGGLGGGARGSNNDAGTPPAGTVNTGGGGGGTRDQSPVFAVPSAGGSGIIIARYPGSQRALGGTVTTTGGFTYHKFTSSSVLYTGLTLPVTGASLWLDASDSANVTRSGSNVTAWLDKSGNGHNFTAPSTKEPLYVTNIQNGLPGIKFFPSSAIKYLTNTSLGNWSASLFTAFLVFNSTNSAGNYPALLGRNQANALQLGGDNSGPSKLAISRITQATQLSSLTYTGTTADVGVYKATSASTSSVTVQTYKNGVAASSTITQAVSATGDKNSIGASVDGAGDSMAPDAYLCEVILYASALSDTDRNKVEGYLRAKWGTP